MERQDDNHITIICDLFNKSKSIRTNNITYENIEYFVSELELIQAEFIIYGDLPGPIHCEKEAGLLYLKAAQSENNLDKKLELLELANHRATTAVMMAADKKYEQPSIPKHQASIKAELGDALHLVGEHSDGDLLINDSLSLLKKVTQRFPDYAEGYAALVEVDYISLKWHMLGVIANTGMSKHLLSKPIHKKHVSTPMEVSVYLGRLDTIENTLNQILAIYK